MNLIPADNFCRNSCFFITCKLNINFSITFIFWINDICNNMVVCNKVSAFINKKPGTDYTVCIAHSALNFNSKIYPHCYSAFNTFGNIFYRCLRFLNSITWKLVKIELIKFCFRNDRCYFFFKTCIAH